MNLEHTKAKGTIHYAVSFYPTLELAKSAEEKKGPADQNTTETEVQETAIGEQVGEANGSTNLAAPEKDLHGELIKYTDDKKIDLLAYESGILSVTVQHIKVPYRTRAVVDMYLDSNYAQYNTTQLRGVDLPFHETGDAFVKEMDFSKLVVKVRRYTDNEKENEILGYCTIAVRDIVRQIMTGEHDPEAGKEINLLDCSNGMARLSFKFTPVIQLKLDPAESLESECEVMMQ
jgi:Ca2+-dependent lipid-binding protein